MILGRGEKLAAVLSAPGGFLGVVSPQVFSLSLGGVLGRRGEGQDEGQRRPAKRFGILLAFPQKNLGFLREVGRVATANLNTSWSCGFGPLTRPLPKIIS
jgi:hypothetical protein